MKWLKENLIWILVLLGVIVLIIVTNIPTIMSLGGGSFLKGIILLPIALVGCILIFKAFAKLLEGMNKVWKGAIILLVMVACMIGFVKLIAYV